MYYHNGKGYNVGDVIMTINGVFCDDPDAIADTLSQGYEVY